MDIPGVVVLLLLAGISLVVLYAYYRERSEGRRRARDYRLWHDPRVWEVGRDVRLFLNKPSPQTEAYEEWLARQEALYRQGAVLAVNETDGPRR